MIAALIASQLTVFAASSLREAFTGLSAAFAKQEPGTKVALQFAGSQELRVQIDNGAAADVFASVDERHMEGLAARPQVFARNELVVVMRADNPAKLRSFDDLPRAERIVLAAPEVPAGTYALQALRDKGPEFLRAVEERVVSRELNVRQVLAKVTFGEADAGIVYRTDARASGRDLVVLPMPGAPVARYPIAALRASASADLARKFVALVLSPAGQDILRSKGFLPP